MLQEVIANPLEMSERIESLSEQTEDTKWWKEPNKNFRNETYSNQNFKNWVGFMEIIEKRISELDSGSIGMI